jgi:hypothetical protein
MLTLAFPRAASFDTYLQLFTYYLAMLNQLHGDVESSVNNFVQQAGKGAMKVMVAYVKSLPWHSPRLTVKAAEVLS